MHWAATKRPHYSITLFGVQNPHSSGSLPPCLLTCTCLQDTSVYKTHKRRSVAVILSRLMINRPFCSLKDNPCIANRGLGNRHTAKPNGWSSGALHKCSTQSLSSLHCPTDLHRATFYETRAENQDIGRELRKQRLLQTRSRLDLDHATCKSSTSFNHRR
jgi:hypothetical protein